MTKIIGLGAGGHAKVVLEILFLRRDLQILGLLTATGSEAGAHILGVPVLGNDEMLPSLIQRGVSAAFIGVGGTGDTARRRALYDRLIELGVELVPVIHPSAVLSPSATLGNGPTIMAGVIINASARLGANVIVNTGAVIEHDVTIGDHVHVATAAKLAGGVIVEQGAHIGIGAAVRQGQRIGAGAIVGAGAVVVSDVPAGAVVVGVPARALPRQKI